MLWQTQWAVASRAEAVHRHSRRTGSYRQREVAGAAWQVAPSLGARRGHRAAGGSACATGARASGESSARERTKCSARDAGMGASVHLQGGAPSAGRLLVERCPRTRGTSAREASLRGSACVANVAGSVQHRRRVGSTAPTTRTLRLARSAVALGPRGWARVSRRGPRGGGVGYGRKRRGPEGQRGCGR